jgi:hypothetical protein
MAGKALWRSHESDMTIAASKADAGHVSEHQKAKMSSHPSASTEMHQGERSSRDY